MIDLFGEENSEEQFKPAVRFGKVLPGYYVSNTGRIFSSKNGKIKEGFIHTSCRTDGTKRIKEVMHSFSIPRGLYEDHDYVRPDRKNCAKIPVSAHRLVAETWKPIDENPPNSLKEDWDKAPESFKQWVKDTAIIDHIDDDPTNNHVDNLRWVTPKENQPIRKLKNNSNERP